MIFFIFFALNIISSYYLRPPPLLERLLPLLPLLLLPEERLTPLLPLLPIDPEEELLLLGAE